MIHSELHTQTNTAAPATTNNTVQEQQLTKAEIRRQMYERMARGSSLAEAENDAHRRWQQG